MNVGREKILLEVVKDIVEATYPRYNDKYIKENIINLKKDLNSTSIYRSDSHQKRDYEFYRINKNLDKKIFFLKKIGESFAGNIKNTISENYLKYFRI